MVAPIRLAPPNSSVEGRLQAVEAAIRQLSPLVLSALRLPPYAAGGTLGQANAGGNPMLDAQGLIQVIAQPGSSVHGGNPGTAYSNVTTPTVIQDGSGVQDKITVTATRNGQQWLVLGDVQVVGPTAGSQAFGCQIYVDGVLPADAGSFIMRIVEPANNGAITLTVFYVATLNLGAHTIDVRLTTGSATNYTVTAFDLYAFRLGS